MTRWLVVSDLDDTLLGPCAEPAVERWLRERRFGFCIATGRSRRDAEAIVHAQGLPSPDFWICDVGTELAWRCGTVTVDDLAWRASLRHFDGDAVRTWVARRYGFTRQGRQTPRKASFIASPKVRPTAFVEELERAGLAATVVLSHGHLLDILPVGGTKGDAVHYLTRRLGLSPDRVIAAGDSDNDRSMLATVRHPVLVANHREEIADLVPRAYVARSAYGAGVMEGAVRAMRCGQ
ncbi:MAG: HAD-IIB family hydrolase [Myxococcota bacterium]